MDIKKHFFFLVFIPFFSFTLIYNTLNQSSTEELTFIPESENNIVPKSSSDPLIDKVYTFNSTYDKKEFSLNLERKFDYYIYVEVVTPNNTCNLAITIWDPDDNIFRIFQRDMISNYFQGDYDEVPFGTALAGVHRIKFNMTCNKNLNLYIRIEKVVECLYDKVDGFYLDNLIYYDVKRFSDESMTSFSVSLETDRMYQFYIGRVSAIADLGSIEKVDLNITDSNNVLFLIYEGILLPDVSDIIRTFFGTAISGSYTINLEFYSTEPHINVAYLLSDDYQISDVIDDTDPNPVENGELQDSLFLPEELILGTLIFVGGITGALTLFFIQRRKKNAVNLDLNKKRK